MTVILNDKFCRAISLNVQSVLSLYLLSLALRSMLMNNWSANGTTLIILKLGQKREWRGRVCSRSHLSIIPQKRKPSTLNIILAAAVVGFIAVVLFGTMTGEKTALFNPILALLIIGFLFITGISSIIETRAFFCWTLCQSMLIL